MKNKILNNFGYKILSVVFAIILWLVVMNISDYNITKEIEDIPVTQLNGDVLEELDQMYDVASGDTVDIIVKGRRSVVSNLSASDFTATADLSTMSITNSVQIFVTPKNKSIADDISITYIDNTMKLNLEDRVEAQFPVKIKTTGSTSTGYAVGSSSANPNIITISGPKSTMDKITEVVVNVSVQNAKADFETRAEIEIYDAYGEPINIDKLTLSDEFVDVSVVIYPVKEIDINVEVKGKPETGYTVSEIIYQPQTIKVAAAEDDLRFIKSIDIDDISVSGMAEDLQTTIDLKEYLDKGVVVADGSTEVVITVKIEKIEDKTYTFGQTNITFKNKKPGYTYKIEFDGEPKIKVSGIGTAIADIDFEDIDLTIDCSDMSVGTHSNVEIHITGPKDLEYEVECTATVTVSE